VVTNRQFQDPGTDPADAAGWTRTTTAAGIFTAFEGLPAHEDFDWPTGLLRTATFEEASFDTRATARSVEDFEDLWGARHARLVSTKEAPFVLQPGQTLTVVVNGTPITVTFQQQHFVNIADARAEEVARVIDRALEGADAFMGPNGRTVAIATTAAGIQTTLAISGGTAAAAFGFPASAGGQDEEGGAFFRRAEFGMLRFKPNNAEADNFADGWTVAKDPPVHDDAARPRLQADPRDELGYFTLVPAETFTSPVFRKTFELYLFTVGTEDFVSASWPDETLTITWGT
jgi:hypothetical protein